MAFNRFPAYRSHPTLISSHLPLFPSFPSVSSFSSIFQFSFTIISTNFIDLRQPNRHFNHSQHSQEQPYPIDHSHIVSVDFSASTTIPCNSSYHSLHHITWIPNNTHLAPTLTSYHLSFFQLFVMVKTEPGVLAAVNYFGNTLDQPVC